MDIKHEIILKSNGIQLKHSSPPSILILDSIIPDAKYSYNKFIFTQLIPLIKNQYIIVQILLITKFIAIIFRRTQLRSQWNYINNIMDKDIKKKVLVYGGSFDPIHKGHQQIIQQLLKIESFDQIWIVPCGNRSDKKFYFNESQRIQMLQNLGVDMKNVRICKKQIQRGEMIPTYFLIKMFEQQFLNNEFYFVIGGDLVNGLDSWHQGKKLKQEVNFLIFNRKGYYIQEGKLPKKYISIEYTPKEVSSSEIRKILEAKIDINSKTILLQEKINKQVLKKWIDQKILS